MSLVLAPGRFQKTDGVRLQQIKGRQPLQFSQGVVGLGQVGGAHRRVHAPDQHALDAALPHGLEQGNPGIARALITLAHLGQVVVGEVVPRGGRLPPEGLEHTDKELGLIDPEAGLGGLFLQVVLQGGVGGLAGGGHVAGHGIEQQPHVRGALDVALPPEGVDAAPGDPHVPQQLLQDGVAADDLDPGGMLGAAHGIEQRAGLARVRRWRRRWPPWP